MGRRLSAMILAVLGWCGVVGCALAQEKTGYAFSPINQAGVQLTAAYWNPILDYVSERSGVKLVLKVGRTSVDSTNYVLAQEVDFVFSNHLFSDERRKLGWKVFARRDYPPVKGDIVVLADSPITDLKQLHEQDMAFSGPESLLAYKVPYAQFIVRGILPRVVFAGNQDGAIAQLRSGKVKAIGANSQLIDGYAKREGLAVRKVWSSEPFNDLALMVSPRVPTKDAKAVESAFLAMGNDPEGREILKKASDLVQFPVFTRFVPTSDSEYQAYFNFYKSAPSALH